MQIHIDSKGIETVRLTVTESMLLYRAKRLLESMSRHGNEYAATAVAALEDVAANGWSNDDKA